ncbi:kinase-like protein [Wallemia mellicola]|uniref:non-specific serine/threonine protein kinase n=1 Tax=Wallemia mellicola TaxID=1708541 RepID=A0A4T0TUK8_9BASI|nr:kinase-like protein [Wallemia mellicola]
MPPSILSKSTKIKVGIHNVYIDRFLTSGGYAHVYICTSSTPINNTYKHVLKRIAVDNLDDLKLVGNEVEIMKLLSNSSNIVNLIDAAAYKLPQGGHEVFILMEYCSGGALIDLMNRHLKTRLTESQILDIFVAVTDAVAHMHSLSILHRDLKIENILQSGPKSFKLCDFGSATHLKPNYKPSNLDEIKALEADLNKHTTIQYRAPEMVDPYQCRIIDEKADVWALGVLLYKLCYYTTPFEQNGPLAILNVQYTIPNYPLYSSSLNTLISSMLREQSSQRPSAVEILKRVHQMRGTMHEFRPPPSKPVKQPSPMPIKTGRPLQSPTKSPSKVPAKQEAIHTKPSHFLSPSDVTPQRRGRPIKLKTGSSIQQPHREKTDDPWEIKEVSSKQPLQPKMSKSLPNHLKDLPKNHPVDPEFKNVAARFPDLDAFGDQFENRSKKDILIDVDVKSTTDPQEESPDGLVIEEILPRHLRVPKDVAMIGQENTNNGVNLMDNMDVPPSKEQSPPSSDDEPEDIEYSVGRQYTQQTTDPLSNLQSLKDELSYPLTSNQEEDKTEKQNDKQEESKASQNEKPSRQSSVQPSVQSNGHQIKQQNVQNNRHQSGQTAKSNLQLLVEKDEERSKLQSEKLPSPVIQDDAESYDSNKQEEIIDNQTSKPDKPSKPIGLKVGNLIDVSPPDTPAAEKKSDKLIDISEPSSPVQPDAPTIQIHEQSPEPEKLIDISPTEPEPERKVRTSTSASPLVDSVKQHQRSTSIGNVVSKFENLEATAKEKKTGPAISPKPIVLAKSRPKTMYFKEDESEEKFPGVAARIKQWMTSTMPDKAKADNKKKQQKNEKSKAKPKVDNTFGMKNKKGGKGQREVQRITQEQAQQGKSKDATDKERQRQIETQQRREAEKKAAEEAKLLAGSQPPQRIPFGVDPKTIVCQYFKAGFCEKGKKCKFLHSDGKPKVEKKDIYSDARDQEQQQQDTMDKWDDDKLREVVLSKHGNPKSTTDIVCKFFIQAIEDSKYGWFWSCPNEDQKAGKQCHYRHALPQGFVLKSQKKREAEEGKNKKEITIEAFLETERHKLGSNLTPVTAESFAKWKKDRVDKKEAEHEAVKKVKEATNAAGRQVGMSGRDLFTFNAEWFEDESEDEGEDWDLSAYRKQRQEEDEADQAAMLEKWNTAFAATA